jgi:hypothetical protein
MPTLLLVILLLLLTGCADRSSESLRLETRDGIVDLAEQLPGEWKRVCLLPPYSTNRMASDLLGFEYNIESRSRIVSSDSITLLLTVDGRSVVDGFEIGRRNIDFSSLGTVCYGRGEATFTLPDQGWPHARHVN